MNDVPPLADTDDPFELLGVDPDADERTIRVAYARLIKVYRPDRHPREFERVHAAFEAATTTDVARAMSLAIWRDVRPQAAPPGESDLASEMEALAVAIRNAVDKPAALDAAVVAGRRLLARDGLVEAFQHDHGSAEAGWRALAALAWLAPDAELHDELRKLPLPRWRIRVIDRAEHDISIAAALAAHDDVPRELRALLATEWVGPADREPELARALWHRLLDGRYRYYELLERVFAHHPQLGRGLVLRLSEELPSERTDHNAIAMTWRAKDLRVSLCTASPATGWVAVLGLAGAIKMAVGRATADDWISIIWILGGVLVIALIALIAMLVGSHDRVRRAVLRATVTAGVTAPAVVEFVYAKLFQRVPWATLLHARSLVAQELGLQLVGALAAWAAERAESRTGGQIA